MPSVAQRRDARVSGADRFGTRWITIGEFCGSARWHTTATAKPTATDAWRGGAREVTIPVQAEEDTDAVGDEIQIAAAAAAAGVMADFAARIAYARKHVPRHQLAAAIAAINAMRSAALATINRNAAMELAAKRRLVQMRRKRPLPRKSNHVPPTNG